MQAAVRTLRPVPNPPGALETLFQAHHDRVFRTAHRITGSAADAEDVLQTIFLRLLKSEDTLDLSPNPEAYLSRAAIDPMNHFCGHSSVLVALWPPFWFPSCSSFMAWHFR